MVSQNLRTTDLAHVASSGKVILSDVFWSMWKETAVAYLRVLYRHLCRETNRVLLNTKRSAVHLVRNIYRSQNLDAFYKLSDFLNKSVFYSIPVQIGNISTYPGLGPVLTASLAFVAILRCKSIFTCSENLLVKLRELSSNRWEFDKAFLVTALNNTDADSPLFFWDPLHPLLSPYSLNWCLYRITSWSHFKQNDYVFMEQWTTGRVKKGLSAAANKNTIPALH